MTMNSTFVCRNIFTGCFFVKGQGFIAQCLDSASLLNSVETTVVNHSYLNVYVIQTA